MKELKAKSESQNRFYEQEIIYLKKKIENLKKDLENSNELAKYEKKIENEGIKKVKSYILVLKNNSKWNFLSILKIQKLLKNYYIEATTLAMIIIKKDTNYC